MRDLLREYMNSDLGRETMKKVFRELMEEMAVSRDPDPESPPDASPPAST